MEEIAQRCMMSTSEPGWAGVVGIVRRQDAWFGSGRAMENSRCRDDDGCDANTNQRDGTAVNVGAIKLFLG